MSAAPGTLSGVFADRYQIERVLGEGATATVYLARDTRAGISVAIKMLRPELAESGAASRFAKEIRRTSSLSHPRILPVLDSGDHEGQLYIVLPYMEGGTLRDRLKREKQLPVDEALAIIRPVAEALDYAHTQGLIHRDVKPENILFTTGQAVLGDFGIARALETVLSETVTSTGIVRGTPAYMSPEQASGSKDLDGRSDQYSLACVLYEMIAGVPAFMGPTPESIIAQRFAHVPRGLRVYRPGVAVALETVVARSLSITPADRYRTTAEFSDALVAAANSVDAVGAAAPYRRPGTLALIGVVAVLIGVGGYMMRGSIARVASGPQALDTTRIALLPIEGSGDHGWRDEDLFHQAVSRWRGVTAVDQFQVADAVRRRRDSSTAGDLEIARSLGAGRVVRARLSTSDTAFRVYATLFDVESRRALYQAAVTVPRDAQAASDAYARLADSLLLRGGTSSVSPHRGPGTRSLPALQAFGNGQRALDDWNLAAADSAFETATVLDPGFARATFWLAQVRAWRAVSRARWASLGERALADTAQLSDRERTLAAAVVELGRGNYAAACALYDRLARRNDRDFAALFGQGQCRSLDRIVIRDRESPTGWRFRSSMHLAMQAYARAFTILPTVHRGYERGAFQRLRVLLFLSNNVITAYGEGDSAVFQARPSIRGDTLVLVPYPWERISAGGPATIPSRMEEALQRQRLTFRGIAANWSTLLPASAEAKHAVAVSLDLLRDPSAIDTLVLARHLTTDPQRQWEYAAAEVLLRVKYGVPADTLLLRSARGLADSVLRAMRVPRQEDAEVLSAVAASTGRCDLARPLMQKSSPPGGYGGIPATVIVRGQTALASAVLDCPRANVATELQALVREIDEAFPGRPDMRKVADAQALLLPALLSGSRESAILERAAASGNSRAVAALALARGDTATARRVLQAADASVTPIVPTPDFALIRARLWLVLADTTAAIKSLDASLQRARAYDVDTFDATNVAALVQASRLRADLATRVGDEATAEAWRTVSRTLWRTR